MASIPKTQKAIVLPELGRPAELVEGRAVPEPGPKEVQIRVSVAGLNPHDAKIRDTGLFVDHGDGFPVVPAIDVVGVITKLGPDVAGFAVGDRIVSNGYVLAPAWNQSGLQEYALATVGCIARIPDSISSDAATTLPTNIAAPLVALFGRLKIPAPWAGEDEKKAFGGGVGVAGSTLLIIGGGANCGRFGVQLAALAGVGRIVVVGGNPDELRALGATHVLDRHGGFDAVLGRIRDVVGDDLILAYDAINPPDEQVLALSALSSHKRGALARLIPLTPVDTTKVVGEKKAGFDIIDVFGISFTETEVAVPFWERVPGYLESGKIKPSTFVVKKGLDPRHVDETLDAYKDGKSVVHTHIHIWDEK